MTRFFSLLVCCLALFLVGALYLVAPAAAETFTVDTMLDRTDGAPGNGECDSQDGAGCTLRAAVMEANATEVADTIVVPAGTYTLSLGGGNDGNQDPGPNQAVGDLDILNDVLIDGAGQATTIVQSGASSYSGIDRNFEAWWGIDGSDVTITDMTIQNGDPGGHSNSDNVAAGGAVRSQNAKSLTLRRVTVKDNFAACIAGGVSAEKQLDPAPGGAPQGSLGTLLIEDSTLATNKTGSSCATSHGGGVLNELSEMTIRRTTLSGNHSTSAGAGIAIWPNSGSNNFVEDSTFTGNTAAGGATGIYQTNGNTLTVRRTLFNGNTAAAGGGAGIGVDAPSSGSTTIEDSTFRNNAAAADGGAIHAFQGSVSISGTTFEANSAPLGGALALGYSAGQSGSASVVNSTFSGNVAGSGGGAVRVTFGQLSLTNATLAGNSASGNSGAAVSNGGGSLTAKNTIFGPSQTGAECAGTITSQGNNLGSDSSCSLVAAGDQPNTAPLLGPLTDNGGPTETMALLAGSPAIDAAEDAACPITDQRGAPRLVDGDTDEIAVCDIGAYERAPFASVSPGAHSFGNVSVGSVGTQDFTITNEGELPLDVDGVNFSPAGAFHFVSTGSTCLSSNVAPGQTCVIRVSFEPTQTGGQSTTMNIATSANDLAVALSGMGAPAAVAGLSANPSPLSFGPVMVNTDETKTVTITNNGGAPLTISSASVSHINGTGFTVASNTCTSSIAVNASCSIGVKFSPTAVQSYDSTLNIISNAAGSPHHVPLSGSGTPAPPPDTTKPQITVFSPAFLEEIERGESRIYSFNCSDSESGIASCEAGDGALTVHSGDPMPTGALGNRTLLISAIDNAGNQTIKEVPYKIVAPPPPPAQVGQAASLATSTVPPTLPSSQVLSGKATVPVRATQPQVNIGQVSGVISAGGANVISAGGANVITAGGANVITAGGANVITAGGANVITAGGANRFAAGVARVSTSSKNQFARRAGSSRKPRLLADGGHTFKRAGKAVFRLRLTALGKKVIRKWRKAARARRIRGFRVRPLKLTLTMIVGNVGGKPGNIAFKGKTIKIKL